MTAALVGLVWWWVRRRAPGSGAVQVSIPKRTSTVLTIEWGNQIRDEIDEVLRKAGEPTPAVLRKWGDIYRQRAAAFRAAKSTPAPTLRLLRRLIDHAIREGWAFETFLRNSTRLLAADPCPPVHRDRPTEGNMDEMFADAVRRLLRAPSCGGSSLQARGSSAGLPPKDAGLRAHGTLPPAATRPARPGPSVRAVSSIAAYADRGIGSPPMVSSHGFSPSRSTALEGP
jgi:hypothetical protein